VSREGEREQGVGVEDHPDESPEQGVARPDGVEAADEGLDQPEDDATEHALRLMDEALRRGDAARRWLVAGDP
jgi:hypothetical protein